MPHNTAGVAANLQKPLYFLLAGLLAACGQRNTSAHLPDGSWSSGISSRANIVSRVSYYHPLDYVRDVGAAR